jgi:hypothetical protein
VAAPSASAELEALETARARLEAALSGDENWRALRQSRAEGAAAGDDPARRARDTRLEMALAGNALYQAWKHTNGAIDALHARRAAQALATAPLEPANPHAVLPDDVAVLLQDEKPKGGAHADRPPVPARPLPRPAAHRPISRLADRLGRLETIPKAEAIQSGPDEDRNVLGRPRRPKPTADPEIADPPEATVTFVVRETPHSAGEQPSDVHSAGNPDAFGQLRSSDRSPEHVGQISSGSEEAEVTIMTPEQREEIRADEQRAGIVRRFRKTLSGD